MGWEPFETFLELIVFPLQLLVRLLLAPGFDSFFCSRIISGPNFIAKTFRQNQV
jgi:hypothetical protein